MVKPFLPDIMQGVVARLDASFSTRAIDKFNVFFDKGIIQQVRRSVYNAEGNFPLVWLVYKFKDTFGTNFAISNETSFQVIIAMPTEPGYTQQQRDDISFKPRLLPIYDLLMKEIKRDKWFVAVGDNGIKHERVILPYWGISETEGMDVPNLFKDRHIDAISVTVTGLKVRRENCGSIAGYNVLDASGYDMSSNRLTFFDDIELIVGGDQPYDPVDKTNTVIIPELIGKDYSVVQRYYGPLRQIRQAEIIPDLINGGFALASPQVFNQDDTYFIKIRPMYMP